MKIFALQKNKEPLEIMNSELSFKYLEGFFNSDGRAVIDKVFISITDKFQDAYELLSEDSVDEIGFIEEGKQFKTDVNYTYYNKELDTLEVYLSFLGLREENFMEVI